MYEEEEVKELSIEEWISGSWNAHCDQPGQQLMEFVPDQQMDLDLGLDEEDLDILSQEDFDHDNC